MSVCSSHKVSLPQQHGLHFDRKIVNVRIKVHEAVELRLGHAQEVEQDEVFDPVDHAGGGCLAPPPPGVGVVGGGPGGGQVPRPVQRVRRRPANEGLLTCTLFVDIFGCESSPNSQLA